MREEISPLRGLGVGRWHYRKFRFAALTVTHDAALAGLKRIKSFCAAGTILYITVCKRGTSVAYGKNKRNIPLEGGTGEKEVDYKL